MFYPNLKCLNLLFLGIALIAASPSSSFAFGSKAPEATSDADLSNADKLEKLHSAINQFNNDHADILETPEFYVNYVVQGDAKTDAECQAAIRSEILRKRGPSIDPLCTAVSGILESNGVTCKDMLEIRLEAKAGSAGMADYYGYGHQDCRVLQLFTVRFYAALTQKAQQLMSAGFLYLSTNTDVEYNVRAIQSALGNLVLLPRQRKTLDGFFGATDAFVQAIDTEKANAAAGKEAKPLTHRSFAEKASLIVAYYRYLKDDFAELAQFSSASGGTFKSNQDSVKVIDSAVTNLTKDYGLDSEITAKQVADYGRVLLDLLNNFSLTLTTTEKATIQPIMVQLVTQVIPASEAYGDVGAHDSVVKLKSIWESTTFTALMTDKLSVSDDKSTALILNMSAAAYKLGLSANVDIKTFDARDADRIKNKKQD